MPLGVALSELRYELRAEIYSSLLPAHGLSAVDMQNAILERTQRELWNLYAWPHLNYRIDFDLPANTQFVDFDPTMPFENVLRLWRNYNPQQSAAVDPAALRLRGLDQRDAASRIRRCAGATWSLSTRSSGLTNLTGQAQIWPIPTQLRTCAGTGKRRSIRSRSTATSA